MNNQNTASKTRFLACVALTLFGTQGVSFAAAGEATTKASSPPWKCDVEIMMSDQYLAKRNQSFDTLFCDKNDHLWVRVFLHWPDDDYKVSDYYKPRSAEYTLISRDKGLTWQLTDAPRPYLCNRSVLPDGTIVELSSNWWERHPVAEKEELEKKGYEVRLDGANKDFCAIIYDTWVRRSTDGGKTWKVRALHKELPFFAYFVSRNYQATLKDGTILSFHYGKRTADNPRSAYVLRSEDAGKTWKLIMIADGRLSPNQPDGFGESFPVVYPDGRVMAMLRTSLSSDAYVVRSIDGGQTWSIPEKTPVQEKHPTLTALADGSVLCTYPRRHATPYGVRARFTSDLGKTWSEEVILRDDIEFSDGIAFPLTVELSDGTLFTTFTGKKHVDKPVRNGAPSGLNVYLAGTRWTRNYCRAPSLDLPRPPRETVQNWTLTDRDPWQNEFKKH